MTRKSNRFKNSVPKIAGAKRRSILFSGVSAVALTLGLAPAMAVDLIVDGPNSPFDIVDGTYGAITVGDTGNGVYQLTDGSSKEISYTGDFTIGKSAGSTGVVSVDNGSHLTVKDLHKTGFIDGSRGIVAGSGSGAVNVTNGSRVTLVADKVNSFGLGAFNVKRTLNVNVTGAGSVLDVADVNPSKNSDEVGLQLYSTNLVISDGARLDLSYDTPQGPRSSILHLQPSNLSGPSTVKITGAGTTADFSRLVLGNQAFVEISDGAQVSSRSDLPGSFGLYAGSMHVTGQNTSLRLVDFGRDQVGVESILSGGGDLLVDDGATVDVPRVRILADTGSFAPSVQGVIKVDGQGSSFNTGAIYAQGGTGDPSRIEATNGGVINIVKTEANLGQGLSRHFAVGGLALAGGTAVNVDGEGSSLLISNQAYTAYQATASSIIIQPNSLSAGDYPTSMNITVSNGGYIKANKIITEQIINNGVYNTQATANINIGAAADQAAVAAGILDVSTINSTVTWDRATDTATEGGDGSKINLVFNHTDSNYQFAPTILSQTHVNAVAGRTVFTADNTYTDGTEIHSGAELQLGNGGRQGSIIGEVANDGTLAFNRADQVDFSGSISGGGLIDQRGAGQLTLSGDSSAFTGVTNVDNGTLLVDGILGGTVNDVVTGGVIGGAGTIQGDLNIGSGGILTGREGQVLTVEGNLTLASDSTTRAALGAPNQDGPGLFNVGGDLTIGGTLDVSNLNGDFGAGIYRIFDYGGTLTDNGMVLGDVDGGDVTQMAIQTNVDHQVNLVNRDGVSLAFWDGADLANHANGKIDGGDGVWTHATNANWTGDLGLVNGGWTDGAFAVFTGAAGTVSVDNSAGDIVADGMQFAVDGYKVKGGAITLGGDNTPVIRVERNATAVVESELRGSMGLKKTDYGTLVLAGDNSYTGGTTVSEGVLQLGNGGSTGSIKGDVLLSKSDHDVGALAFNRSDNYDFAGNITGEGEVLQLGTGVTTLSGNNSFADGLNVQRGTVRAGSATAFSTGSLTINQGASADLNGFGMTLASVANGGTIAFGGTGGTQLNVSGDYASNNGTLVMNTVFAGDNSKTDRLVVAGNISGDTKLKFVNQGGAGGLTDQGIKVVEVGGSSHGNFALAGDFVTADGQQAVVGGAYAYTLHQNGLDTPNDGDWYLRSRRGANGDGDGPILNPGVPTYTVGPNVIGTINKGGFGGLGDRTHGGNSGDINGNGGGNSQNRASDGSNNDGIFRDHYVWGRIEGGYGQFSPNGNISDGSYDTNSFRMQAGVDGVFNETKDGIFMGSVWLDYVNSQADVSSRDGDGEVNVDGYGIGAGLTWFNDNGFYVDGEGKINWYRSKYESSLANKTVADGVNSFGYALSIEAGQKVTLNERWSVTPQAQLLWSSVNTDSYRDVFNSEIDTPNNNSLTARFGTAVDYGNSWSATDGSTTRLTVGGIANIYQQLNSTADYITISDVRVAAGTIDKTWGEIGLNTNYSWMNDKYAVYGKLSTATSLNHFSDSYTVTGNVGFRVKW